MIRPCGVVWGPVDASYLYAVVAADSVYFGESRSLAKRWAAHIQDVGSSALRRLGQLEDLGALTPGDFAFFGLRCEVVDGVPVEKQRLARRAIEEELHRQFYLRRSAMAPVERVLSTPPPSPIRHRFPFDVVDAGKVAYQLIVEQHRRWRESL